MQIRLSSAEQRADLGSARITMAGALAGSVPPLESVACKPKKVCYNSNISFSSLLLFRGVWATRPPEAFLCANGTIAHNPKLATDDRRRLSCPRLPLGRAQCR